jgi:hypothetical protein
MLNLRTKYILAFGNYKNYLNLKKVLFFLLLFCSCKTNTLFISSETINTEFNDEYKNSTKTYVGDLTAEQYKSIRNVIEKELPTKISHKQPILINYRRKGKNCGFMKNNGEHYLEVLNNSINISSRISRENKVANFFVFNKDAFFLDKIKMKKNFILDSGFFSDNIFTIDENCSGFFVLKTDGTFMKYYGEDYYSRVIEFLIEK